MTTVKRLTPEELAGIKLMWKSSIEAHGNLHGVVQLFDHIAAVEMELAEVNRKYLDLAHKNFDECAMVNILNRELALEKQSHLDLSHPNYKSIVSNTGTVSDKIEELAKKLASDELAAYTYVSQHDGGTYTPLLVKSFHAAELAAFARRCIEEGRAMDAEYVKALERVANCVKSMDDTYGVFVTKAMESALKELKELEGGKP